MNAPGFKLETTLCEVWVGPQEDEDLLNSENQVLPTLKVNAVREINERLVGNQVETHVDIQKHQVLGSNVEQGRSKAGCNRNIALSGHGVAMLCCHAVSSKKVEEMSVRFEDRAAIIYDSQKDAHALSSPDRDNTDYQSYGRRGEEAIATNASLRVHLTYALNSKMHDSPNETTHITIRREVDAFYKMADNQITQLEIKSPDSLRKGNIFNQTLCDSMIRVHTTQMAIFAMIKREFDHTDKKYKQKRVYFWEDLRLLFPEKCICEIDKFIREIFMCLCQKEIADHSLEGIVLSENGVIPRGSNFTSQNPIAIGSNANIPKSFACLEGRYKNCLIHPKDYLSSSGTSLNSETLGIDGVWFKSWTYYDKDSWEKMLFIADGYTELNLLLGNFIRNTRRAESSKSLRRPVDIQFFVLTRNELTDDEKKEARSKINTEGYKNHIKFESYIERKQLNERVSELTENAPPNLRDSIDHENSQRSWDLYSKQRFAVVAPQQYRAPKLDRQTTKLIKVPIIPNGVERIVLMAADDAELIDLLENFGKYDARSNKSRFFVLTRDQLTEGQKQTALNALNSHGCSRVDFEYNEDHNLPAKLQEILHIPHVLLLLGQNERVPLRMATDSLDFFKLSTWKNFDSTLVAKPDLIAIIGQQKECEEGITQASKDFPGVPAFGFSLGGNSNMENVITCSSHEDRPLLEDCMAAKGFPIMESFGFNKEKQMWI